MRETYYKKIKLKNGKSRDEHRLIMEKHLGRILEREEVVHHINGDIKDNRIENLQVMSISEHGYYHAKRYMSNPKVKERYSKMHKNKPRKFFKYSLKDIQNIKKLRNEGMPWYVISKITGIPKSSVRDLYAVNGLCYQELMKGASNV